jgi:hypothetical protein
MDKYAGAPDWFTGRTGNAGTNTNSAPDNYYTVDDREEEEELGYQNRYVRSPKRSSNKKSNSSVGQKKRRPASGHDSVSSPSPSSVLGQRRDEGNLHTYQRQHQQPDAPPTDAGAPATAPRAADRAAYVRRQPPTS